MRNGKIDIQQAFINLRNVVDSTHHIVDKLLKLFISSDRNSCGRQNGEQLAFPFDGYDDQLVRPVRGGSISNTTPKAKSGEPGNNRYLSPVEGGGRFDAFH